MRFAILTPGTGSFYCGTTIRDSALAKSLTDLGHEVSLVPLYLPLVHDGIPPVREDPLFLGGVNMFLQHKAPLFRSVPRWMSGWLDNARLLRRASEFMGMTRIRDLGTMTLDSYRGSGGGQRNEWRRLVDWLVSQHPGVVILSNGLLCGVARELKQQGGASIRVIGTLQGEDSFLETLPDPFRSQCWDAFRDCCPFVDAFVAPSGFYRDRMAQALELPRNQIHVIPAAIDTSRHASRNSLPELPTIGFLARMCKGKGLDTLVDAFLLLTTRGSVQGVRLHIGGTKTRADRSFVRMLESRIGAAGCGDSVAFYPNLSFDEKRAFLGGLSLLSVPATYGEAFGLYVAEAMASGVPVVQPDHGPFPEIVGDNDAGLLVAPDDAGALATGLERMLLDPELQAQTGRSGRRAAVERFDAMTMAHRHVQLLRPWERQENEHAQSHS